VRTWRALPVSNNDFGSRCRSNSLSAAGKAVGRFHPVAAIELGEVQGLVSPRDDAFGAFPRCQLRHAETARHGLSVVEGKCGDGAPQYLGEPLGHGRIR
jgi:hypothetical protein